MSNGHNSHNEHQNNEHNEHQNNHLKELKMLLLLGREMGVKGTHKGASSMMLTMFDFLISLVSYTKVFIL